MFQICALIDRIIILPEFLNYQSFFHFWVFFLHQENNFNYLFSWHFWQQCHDKIFVFLLEIISPIIF